MMERAALLKSYFALNAEAEAARMANTIIGNLASAEKSKEAALVADRIGGAQGAACHAEADQFRSYCLCRLRDYPAAARAACSALRAARASGCRTLLILALGKCGEVAREAPGEMVNSERESREQERRSGSPSYGDLDLSREGRVSLPTTRLALSRLCLAYQEAAVHLCDAALAAAGGRGSPAASDTRRIPSLSCAAL